MPMPKTARTTIRPRNMRNPDIDGLSTTVPVPEHTHRSAAGPAVWCLLACLAFAQPAAAAWLDRTEEMMGTRISVRLWHEEGETARAGAAAAVDAAIAEIDRI